ncbi:MAG: hypothetical protein P1Q69_21475, partial [Candidatus Thorarchaeota archaeon]|nr:hypothetical protein [Candidatus Thorarchaeota archaeon]
MEWYYQKGAGWASAISFIVSFLSRGLLILFSSIYNDRIALLVYFPIWIGIEMFLIVAFSLYGWIFVSLSIMITNFFQPYLIVYPIIYSFFEISIITISLLCHYSGRLNSLTGTDSYDYVFSITLPFLMSIATASLILFHFSVTLLSIDIIQLILLFLGYYTVLLLFSYPSMQYIKQRKENPLAWGPPSLMRLLYDTTPNIATRSS